MLQERQDAKQLSVTQSGGGHGHFVGIEWNCAPARDSRGSFYDRAAPNAREAFSPVIGSRSRNVAPPSGRFWQVIWP